MNRKDLDTLLDSFHLVFSFPQQRIFRKLFTQNLFVPVGATPKSEWPTDPETSFSEWKA